jgi:DNA-binding GntR family transcriptional regulator
MDDQDVSRQLKEAITTGQLVPGTKLAEEPLAAAFDISRMRMRETLRMLSFAGLVDLMPNRGAFVARPTRKDAVAAYGARRLIEGEVARLTAAHIGKSALRGLRAHLKRERAARERGDKAAFVKLIGEFHVVLAEASGNPVLAQFVAQLVARTSLIIQLYERPVPSPCSTDEHVAIIEKIARGDGKGAARAMSEHLSAIERRLSFDEPEETAPDFRALFSPRPQAQRTSRRGTAQR